MATLRFPDVQRLLIDALETGGLVAAGHAGIETPGNLEEVLPFVRVVRAAGFSDRLTDFASVQVDVFDELYTTTEALAENIRQWLVGPPPPAARLDRVDCESAPQELPWDDASPVRRFGATYRVLARRYAA